MSSTNSQSMVPPTGTQKEKNPDLKLIPMGFQPAFLYGIVVTGTHSTKFGDKKEVMLFYEFPFIKGKIYKDDTEEKVLVLNEKMSYNIFYDPKKNQYSTLARRLKSGFGVDVTKKGIDLSEFIGKPVIVQVVHNTAANGTVYANVENVGVMNEMMISGRESEFKLTNDLMLFDISFGFESENYAGIYTWVQKRIQESNEAKLHASKGGKFAEYKGSKKAEGTTADAQQPAHPVQDAQQPQQAATQQVEQPAQTPATAPIETMPTMSPEEAFAEANPLSPQVDDLPF